MTFLTAKKSRSITATLTALAASVSLMLAAATPAQADTVDSEGRYCSTNYTWVNGSIGYKNCVQASSSGYWWSNLKIQNNHGSLVYVDSQFYLTVDNGAPRYASRGIYRYISADSSSSPTVVDPYNQGYDGNRYMGQNFTGLNFCTPGHKYKTFVRVRVSAVSGGGSWGPFVPSVGFTCRS